MSTARMSPGRLSTGRLTCLLATSAVAAAGLVPAVAAPAPVARPAFVELDPARALRAATRDLLSAPSAQTAAGWRGATLAVAGDPEEASSTASSSPSTPRDHAFAYSAGDVDGDRREDVVVLRLDDAVVRSGRDGRVLLRRKDGFLLPVGAPGRVRLVALDPSYEETSRGVDITVRYSGLDGRGRTVWTHETSGSVVGEGVGPAYAVTYDSLPLLLGVDHVDAQGRPALLLGGITGAGAVAAGAAQMALSALSVQDGAVTALPALHGAGGIPWASPMDPGLHRGCYVGTEPAGAVTLTSLRCAAGAPSWTRPVPLQDAYAHDGHHFDADGRGDVLVSTFGFDPPETQDPLRGSRVLSGANGSTLGASSQEGLVPLRGDVSGDREPDFLQISFAEQGFALQGVTLAGKVLYRRTIEFRSSGFLEGQLALDVTGDGIGDAFLRAEPERGTPVAIVLDGRSGRALTVPRVDALVAPGLRPRGADLLVLDAVGRRPHVTVLSGDRGRPLLSAPLVARPAPVAGGGSAAALHLDGDRRRDLVVATRVGDVRLITAYSARGRVLWNVAEKVRAEEDAVVVVVGSG